MRSINEGIDCMRASMKPDQFDRDVERAWAEECEAQDYEYPWNPERMLKVMKTQLQLIEANFHDPGDCRQEVVALVALAKTMDVAIATWFWTLGGWCRVHRRRRSVTIEAPTGNIDLDVEATSGGYRVFRTDSFGKTEVDLVHGQSKLATVLQECLEDELEQLCGEKVPTRLFPFEAEMNA